MTISKYSISEFFMPMNLEGKTIDIPTSFNYPFAGESHPLAILAAHDLQKRISEDHRLHGEFGILPPHIGPGKMLGVLVVKNKTGELGYLSAFSGKLLSGNFFPGFVPPIFDTLDVYGFYKRGEEKINVINRTIEKLQNDPVYLSLLNELQETTKQAEEEINLLKQEFNSAKKKRKESRLELVIENEDTPSDTLQKLNNESIRQHYIIKDTKKNWAKVILEITNKISVCEDNMTIWKEKRKKMSATLQGKLFRKYAFLNIHGELKNLTDIFGVDGINFPPSGAGECSAPKLLQFAFANEYTPITMAEFWWGKSPNSEIRKHGHFYPACNSKCKPILGHMLDGIPIEKNPMLSAPKQLYQLHTLYEDDFILAVNKPPNFLSVPGKTVLPSVYSIIKKNYLNISGPIIVHRLDMSTSGIMLIAKNKDIHKNLQKQFLERKIHKTYLAILDGVLDANSGSVDLPLRVDLIDRPRQLVCFDHGKLAITQYEVISRTSSETKIKFFPITGRTHQLRVHAAHPQGLNIAIKGDDLYGKKEKRLYLHAENIEFSHPVTNQKMVIHCSADF